jgi:hypothetical protein
MERPWCGKGEEESACAAVVAGGLRPGSRAHGALLRFRTTLWPLSGRFDVDVGQAVEELVPASDGR